MAYIIVAHDCHMYIYCGGNCVVTTVQWIVVCLAGFFVATPKYQVYHYTKMLHWCGKGAGIKVKSSWQYNNDGILPLMLKNIASYSTFLTDKHALTHMCTIAC